MIEYRVGNQIDSAQTTELYVHSGLGDRRPIHVAGNVEAMLKHANLVVSAWSDKRLVGISRCFSDFTYVTYLSDLAVHRDFQRRGIGKELMRRTQLESGPQVLIVLIAAPASVDYYPHVGLERHPSAWLIRPDAVLAAPRER